MKKRPDNRQARRAWEKHNLKKLEPGLHVHHIDGNYLNNDPLNLVAVTALEHFNIHLKQNDYAACIMLSKSAQISSEELGKLQYLHGKKCSKEKVGIHSNDFNKISNLKNIWVKNPPGRKPVTNGVDILKFKTEKEIEDFLANHVGWYRGLPEKSKHGLKLSKRRLSSEESKKISTKRINNGTHNFLTEHTCPYCNKKGKGPMMKRWHFDNCKEHDKKYE
jgi:hypothetical protein